MEATFADSIVAEAIVKDVSGFDKELAWEVSHVALMALRAYSTFLTAFFAGSAKGRRRSTVAG